MYRLPGFDRKTYSTISRKRHFFCAPMLDRTEAVLFQLAVFSAGKSGSDSASLQDQAQLV